MKTRRRTVSEDGLTISRSNTRSETTTDRRDDSEPIPIDLIYEILSRLPAKSIAKCRCVSKIWSSILGGPDFTELFLTRSCARPQLLFSCRKDGELFFFSSPQPQLQNLDENASPVVTTNQLTRFPFNNDSSKICGHVLGLVCLTDLRIVNGRRETVPVICNPSTGHSSELPKVKTRRVGVISFFGYDPIGKQFKILSMSSSTYGKDDGTAKEHQVLTLGTKQPSWRMIECSIPHYPEDVGICISGGLYYQAGTNMVVCFDVRSEKFGFINKPEDTTVTTLLRYSTLVNYKGKLGALVSGYPGVRVQDRYLELWVLEDPEKHEWSKHIHVLPPLWKNVIPNTSLYFIGVTGTNEIVLTQGYLSDPLCVFYYNLEWKTIRRVEIQGMSAFKYCGVRTSLHHVENVKLMQMF